MALMDKPLPDFENPPVVEVALSVQFDPVKDLRAPIVGFFWNEVRDRFPVIHEQPPLEPVYERFGVPADTAKGGIQLRLIDSPPPSRCWFVNESGTELIQVQNDRFIHNWRKISGQGVYPRYETLRETFRSELNRFHNFLAGHKLSPLVPNQCEVTYVNHIVAGESWKSHAEYPTIFSPVGSHFSDEFLPQPEDARFDLRFVIPDSSGNPVGRLHVHVEPVLRTGDLLPMYLLVLTARGEPAGTEVDAVMSFLDIGREWVVRGFASLTTTEMHRVWRRKDVQ